MQKRGEPLLKAPQKNQPLYDVDAGLQSTFEQVLNRKTLDTSPDPKQNGTLESSTFSNHIFSEVRHNLAQGFSR